MIELVNASHIFFSVQYAIQITITIQIKEKNFPNKHKIKICYMHIVMGMIITAANALLLIEVRKSLTQFPFSFPKSTETSRIASLVIGNSKCIILTNYNT